MCEEEHFIVRSLHEYRTDSTDHLSFGQYQYIIVNRCDVSGWWHGESENQCGWFPSNRVERVEHMYEIEYSSRPTSITSEDYDQIKTGLDGVETQFLGEPVTESVSDSMQMDWSTNSPVRRTRAGQLAFPPSQLSMPQSYYATGSPSATMEGHLLHQHTSLSTTGINGSEAAFGYTDFTTTVALHVKELREAAARKEVERYRPIVIGILSFVRDLLVVTDTMARDSEVLQTYPELSASRQDVLRALGNLYSKCEVADGTRTGMSLKKRRLAVEKLGFFGGRVLAGVTEFTNYAQEIGLRIKSMSSPVEREELGIPLIASKNTESIISPPSHGRPRRRVSRANSAKGYKSFNAVRQWKAEHLQKYSAAKKAIEFLQTEYMECLDTKAEVSVKGRIVTATTQAAQVVNMFLISAEEIRTKTNAKEDNEYAIHRSRLSSALIGLYEYIQVVESTAWSEAQSVEMALNRFMSIAAFLWGCLVDLDVHSRSNQTSQELIIPQTQNSSLGQKSNVQNISSATPTTVSSAETPTSNPTGQELHSAAATNFSSGSPKVITSRNTAPARPNHAADSTSPTSPLGRKFASLNALSDRYKQQAVSQPFPDKEMVRLIPEATYDEGNDLERNNPDICRPSHDSAVVITSAKGTPHHSLMTGYKGPTAAIPTVAEEDGSKNGASSDSRPNRQGEVEQAANEADVVIKSAKVAAIFMPVMAMSQLTEETITPTLIREKQPIQQDSRASRSTTTQPQHTPDSKPSTAPSRSSRAANTTLGSAQPSRTPRTPRASRSPRTPRSSDNRRGSPARNDHPHSVGIEKDLPENQNIIGLGVSVPTAAHPKNASSVNSSQGSDSFPRPSGTGRSRTPIPSSPKQEPSKRIPRTDHSPNPNSPSRGTESRTFARGESNSSLSLSPAVISDSKRGSQNSTRSVASGRRRSNDSQYLRENDPRNEQDRRRPSNQAGPRRGSNSGASLRAEPLAKDEDVFLGPSTPMTPNIHTFVDSHAQQRPNRNQHRESVVSNLSAATEESVSSRAVTNVRAPSPALRSRMNHQDLSAKGRLSSESNVSVDKHHHHQQPQQGRSGPGATSYRPRQNRVGQAKDIVSSELKHESETSATPWYLENDYESDDVLYNESGVLVAASLEAYIEILTSHKSAPEPSFVVTFFTTFRLFVSPVELIHLLTKRFTMAPPHGLCESELVLWQQKQEHIQKRVHIALKTWLEGYWVSEKDRAAFIPIMDFVTQEMAVALPGPSSRLSDMLNQWTKKRGSLCLSGRPQTLTKSKSDDRLNQTAHEQNQASSQSNGNSSNSNRLFGTVKEKSSADQTKNTGRRGLGGFGNRDSTQSRGPPVPLVNKALLTALANDQAMTKIPVTEIKAIELARQLTIMVGKLYLEIPYLEILAKERPNCSRMIQLSNKITMWVTETIVDEQDIKKRIGLIKHWIEVGEECLKLNNFDTLTAISCAIESTPVKRLYNTWEGINKTYFERSLQLKKMISSEYNYSVYRAKLKSIHAPCIPFLGLYFTVIAYIEDGNSIYKENNPVVPTTSSTVPHAAPSTPTPASTRKLLRYGRFEKLAKAVQEFREFQGVYELLEVPRLREYILKCMNNLENLDSERSYRKSLAIEPRKPPAYIPGNPGGNGANGNGGGGNGIGQRSNAGGVGQRASGINRGIFNSGISNSEMNSNSMPAKLNKLSFFRKSTRSERS
ncbi:hypothetical protein BGX27_003342 [Mortierella sp. AM989]|nr:hypothetical protein BGX27_003342 [Mortierella sp. AM989]